ncbi:MAG: dipeptidyl aminopeptidase/acylaminoacyl-peptidase-like protein [Caulobacter sp.]|nr:dipeptidyl aminopeptidase/acylaminoacyl-peptidase-like protein [Caulobacter sp.]
MGGTKALPARAPLRWALGFSLLVVTVLAMMAGGARAASLAEIFAYDAAAPLDVRFGTLRHPAKGVTARDISFIGAGGHRVTGELIEPDQVKGRLRSRTAGVLFVHWLGEAKTTNHTEFDGDAAKLAVHGVTSLLVDAMWADPKWFDTMGKDAASDYRRTVGQVVELRRALDLLTARPGVDPTRIAYVGHDFGAMMGQLLAGVDSRPKVFVFMAGTATLPEWYLLGKKSPDKAGYEAALAPLDLLPGLARSKAKGFFFQFSARDEYIPNERGLMVFNAAPTPKEAHVYDAGHDLDVPAAHAERVAWLLKMLT